LRKFFIIPLLLLNLSAKAETPSLSPVLLETLVNQERVGDAVLFLESSSMVC
jgi:hypothetical protein